MTTLAERLRHVEVALADLSETVGTLRVELQDESAPTVSPRPYPAMAPPAPRPVGATRRPAPIPAMNPVAPRPVADPKPPIDWFGPRTLAWSGGVAMLLGIVFFFVLAVRNGWVQEELRVALGVGVSFAALGVARWLRVRVPETPAALTTAAVGIGGLFATLFAATRLYGFVPEVLGIVLAIAIGAGAVAMGLRWKAEVIGALGLVGAIFGAQIIDVVPSPAGVAMVAVAFAAATAITVRHKWFGTAIASVVAVFPQTMALIADAGFDAAFDVTGVPWGVVAAAAFVATICLILGALWQLRHGDETGVQVPALVAVSGNLVFGISTALLLLPTNLARAAALGVLAIGHLAVGQAMRSAGQRDSSSILSILGVALATGSLTLSLDGLWRVAALSAFTVVVGLFAKRTNDDRVYLAAAGALTVANAFAFALAPPIGFFEQELLPGINVLGLFAAAAAAIVLTVLRGADAWRRIGSWTSVALGLLAISVGLLTTVVSFASPAGVDQAFQRGHMIVSFVWALLGLAALWAGVRHRKADLRTAGPVLLIAALAKLFLFDLANLQAMTRALSFLVVGGVLMAGAVLIGRVSDDDKTDATSPPQPADVAAETL